MASRRPTFRSSAMTLRSDEMNLAFTLREKFLAMCDVSVADEDLPSRDDVAQRERFSIEHEEVREMSFRDRAIVLELQDGRRISRDERERLFHRQQLSA